MATEAEIIPEPISIVKTEESRHLTSELCDKAVEFLPVDLKKFACDLNQPAETVECLSKAENMQVPSDNGVETKSTISEGNAEISKGEGFLISPEIVTVASKETCEMSEHSEVDVTQIKAEKIPEDEKQKVNEKSGDAEDAGTGENQVKTTGGSLEKGDMDVQEKRVEVEMITDQDSSLIEKSGSIEEESSCSQESKREGTKRDENADIEFNKEVLSIPEANLEHQKQAPVGASNPVIDSLKPDETVTEISNSNLVEEVEEEKHSIEVKDKELEKLPVLQGKEDGTEAIQPMETSETQKASDEMKRDEEITVPLYEGNISEVESVDVLKQSQEGNLDEAKVLKESFQEQNEAETEKPACPLNAVYEDVKTAISTENEETSTSIKEVASIREHEEKFEREAMEDATTNTSAVNENKESKDNLQIEVNENTESVEVEIPCKNADDLHVADSLVGQSVEKDNEKQYELSNSQLEEQVDEANIESKEKEEHTEDVSEEETTTDLKSETSEMAEEKVKEVYRLDSEKCSETNDAIESKQDGTQEEEEANTAEKPEIERGGDTSEKDVTDEGRSNTEQDETKERNEKKTVIADEDSEQISPEIEPQEGTETVTSKAKEIPSLMEEETVRDFEETTENEEKVQGEKDDNSIKDKDIEKEEVETITKGYMLESKEQPESKDAVQNIAENSKQEETGQVCESPEPIIKEKCAIKEDIIKGIEEETSTSIKEVASIRDHEEKFEREVMEATTTNTSAVNENKESKETDNLQIEVNETTEGVEVEIPNKTADDLHVADSLVGQSVEKDNEKQHEFSDSQPEEEVHEANVESKEKEEHIEDVSEAATTTDLKSETSEMAEGKVKEVYLLDSEKCSETNEVIESKQDGTQEEEEASTAEKPGIETRGHISEKDVTEESRSNTEQDETKERNEKKTVIAEEDSERISPEIEPQEETETVTSQATESPSLMEEETVQDLEKATENEEKVKGEKDDNITKDKSIEKEEVEAITKGYELESKEQSETKDAIENIEENPKQEETEQVCENPQPIIKEECAIKDDIAKPTEEETHKSVREDEQERHEAKDAVENIEENLKQEVAEQVCESPEPIRKEECAIKDDIVKPTEEEMHKSVQEDEQEIPKIEVFQKVETNNTVEDAEKQNVKEEDTNEDRPIQLTETVEEISKEKIEDDSKAESNFKVSTSETDKEDSFENKKEEREPEKEVCEESETASLGMGKENPDMDEHPIADISNSSISEEAAKESIKEDESSSMKLTEEATNSNIEEMDSTAETTLQTSEETAEPNNNPSLLDTVKESNETTREIKEDLVCSSSVETEKPKKDTEEETSAKGTIDADGLDIASTATETEETNIKEVQAEEKKQDINNVIAVEKNGLSTTEQEGIGVDNADIDVKPADSISCEKNTEIPQEDQLETTARDVPLKEILGDEAKEHSTIPPEEHELAPTEERKITDDTSENEQVPDEHSETPEETLTQNEYNPTLDVPKVESEDTGKQSEHDEPLAEEPNVHTEKESEKCISVSEATDVSKVEEPRELENLSDACESKTSQEEQSSDLKLESEKTDDQNSLDEATNFGETSSTCKDGEKALAENLSKPESLKEETEVEREETELLTQAHDQMAEAVNDAKNVGIELAGFEEKPKSDSETVAEDQKKEAFPETSKSPADEISTDVQNQETKKQIKEELEEKLEDESHINREQKADEVTKAVISSEEVDKEVKKAEDSEDIKEHVTEEEHRGTKEDAETEKSLTAEELNENEVEETKGIPETSSDYISQGVETIVEDDISSHNTLPEEKQEEQLQSSASALPAEDEEIRSAHQVEKIEEEIQKDAEVVKYDSLEDSSSGKTTEEVCLQIVDQKELKAVSEEETIATQGLQKEEPEEQIQTTSTLPSEEREHGTGITTEETEEREHGTGITTEETEEREHGTGITTEETEHDKTKEEVPAKLDVLSGEEITGEQTLLANKSEEWTTSSALLPKEEEELLGMVEEIQEENIKEAETPDTKISEDSSGERKMAEISMEKEEFLELEDAKKDETPAAQDLQADEQKDQTTISSSTLPSEDVELRTIAKADEIEEEKVKEVELLEKERPQETEAVVDQEEKQEEQLQTSASTLPSEDEEIRTAHQVEKIEEVIQKDAEAVKHDSLEDSSSGKTTEEICLQNVDQRELKAVSEEETIASQGLEKEEPEEQIQTTSSTLPSEQGENGTGVTTEETEHDKTKEEVPAKLDVLTGEEITGVQTLSANKSETTSFALLPKEEEETVSMVEKLEEENIKEVETSDTRTSEDSSGENKTAEISVEKEELPEFEAAKKDETPAARDLQAQEPKDQSFTSSSALPSEDVEHETIAKAAEIEEEKVKEVELLEKERPPEPEAVLNREEKQEEQLQTSASTLPSEDEEIRTAHQVEKIEEDIEKDAEVTHESLENSSKRETTEEVCLQKGEQRELKAALEEETIAGQGLEKKEAEEQSQTTSFTLPSEDKEHGAGVKTEEIEYEKTKEEVHAKQDALTGEEITGEQTLSANKSEEGIASSALLPKEEEETVSMVKKIDEENIKEVETPDTKISEDSSGENKTAEISVEEEELPELEDAKKDETPAARDLLVQEPKDQSFTSSSALPSEDVEHETIAKAAEIEEEKVKEVELLEKERPPEPEAVLDREEKQEEQLQTSASTLPSEDEEIRTAHQVEKIEEDIEKDAEVTHESLENSSNRKTTEEVCLQKGEQRELKAALEEETIAGQGLEKKEAEEQSQTTSFTLPSEEKEHGAGVKTEEIEYEKTKEEVHAKQDALTGEEITGEQTLSANKSEEGIASSALLPKEEEETVSMVKKIDEENIKEVETPDTKISEDSSGENKTAEISVEEEELPELEDARKDETPAARDLLVQEPKDQSFTSSSALPSEDVEHETIAKAAEIEEEKVKEVELLEKERPPEPEAVLDREEKQQEQLQTSASTLPSEEKEHGAGVTTVEIEYEKTKEEVHAKQDALTGEEITGEQTLSANKSEEGIASSALLPKEQEEVVSMVEKIKEENIKEVETPDTKISEDYFGEKKTAEISVEKEEFLELEDAKKGETPTAQDLQAEEPKDQSLISSSTLPSEDVEHETTAKADEIEEEKVKEVELLEKERPQETEAVMDLEEKEEQLQTSASIFPSEDEEIRTAHPVEKIEEIEKDAEVKHESLEESSDRKTTEEVCLQKVEQRELKAASEEETIAGQGLEKEEPKEQIETTSSTLPSEERELGAGVTTEEIEYDKTREEVPAKQDVLTGEEINGEPTLSANKSEEETTSFALLPKEQEEAVSMVEKIEEENIKEVETPETKISEDSSGENKVAEMSVEKEEFPELEDAKKNETPTAQDLQAEEPKDQSLTSSSTLPSEDLEHGTIAKADEIEEEKVEEVEILEKERPQEPEVVLNREIAVPQASLTEKSLETISSFEKLDDEKTKEAEKLENENCEDSSARGTEEICLQKDEPTELHVVPTEEITSGQTFSEEKSDEHTSASTITSEEQEHETKKIEDEKTNKEEIIKEESPEDASGASTVKEICSQKERPIDLEAVVEEKTTDIILTEKKLEEQVENPTSAPPLKEEGFVSTSESREKAECLQDDKGKDVKEELQEGEALATSTSPSEEKEDERKEMELQEEKSPEKIPEQTREIEEAPIRKKTCERAFDNELLTKTEDVAIEEKVVKESDEARNEENQCKKTIEENENILNEVSKEVIEDKEVTETSYSTSLSEELPKDSSEGDPLKNEQVEDKTNEAIETITCQNEELIVETRKSSENEIIEKQIVFEDKTVEDPGQVSVDRIDNTAITEEESSVELSQAQGTKDLGEGNEITDDIQQPQETSKASDEQIPRELDPTEIIDVRRSIGKEDLPIDLQDRVAESSEKDEIGDIKEVYSKVEEVEHGAEQTTDDLREEITKESVTVEDSTKVSLSGHVESSSKETVQVTAQDVAVEREVEDKTCATQIPVEKPEESPTQSSKFSSEEGKHEVKAKVDSVEEEELKEVETLDKDSSDTKPGAEICLEKEENKKQKAVIEHDTIAVKAPTAELKEDKELAQPTVSHFEDVQKEGEKKEATVEDMTKEILKTPAYETQREELSVETQKDGVNNIIERENVAEDKTVKDLEQASFGMEEERTVKGELQGEPDAVESTGTISSFGKEHFPTEHHDRALETTDKAEVRDLEPGKAQEICLEAGVDHGEEKKTDNSGLEIIQEPASADSAKSSLTDLLQKSTGAKLQVAKDAIQEREQIVSKEEPHVEKEETVQAKEAKTDEEKEEGEGYEHSKADSGSDAPVMVEAPRDTDTKPHKKSHNILSGMGSKVKHSISKVKKAITGKSSHSKEPKPTSPKEIGK